MLNLAHNTVHHNRSSGWVRIETGIDATSAWLTVANSGPVVPADKIEQIFEPFRRLTRDRTSEGRAGLGLSIARAISRAHGGEITARALDEGGLHVCVRLPAAASDLVVNATPAQIEVRAFADQGFEWGGNWSSAQDYQHFSANGK